MHFMRVRGRCLCICDLQRQTGKCGSFKRTCLASEEEEIMS